MEQKFEALKKQKDIEAELVIVKVNKAAHGRIRALP